MPWALADVSAAAALVVARLALHLIELMLADQGMSAPMLCSRLEGGNVFQSQSSRVVGRLGSLSRGAQPSLLSRMPVHPLCPATRVVQHFVSDPETSQHLSLSTDIHRGYESCRGTFAHCVDRMSPSATRFGLRS